MLVEGVVLYLDTEVIQEKIACKPPSVRHLIKKIITLFPSSQNTNQCLFNHFTTN